MTGDDDDDRREQGTNADDRTRRRSLNLSRYAYSTAAKSIIANATQRALEVEQAAQLRKNRRRPADHETFVLTVDAVLSDLMYRHLTHPGEELFISRSNRKLSEPLRYRQRARNKQLPPVLDLLARPELGYLVQQVADKGRYGGTATLVRAGEALIEEVSTTGLNMDDFHTHREGDAIVLRRAKDEDDYWDRGAAIDYADTPQTTILRNEVDAFNRWLASADLGSTGEEASRPFDLRERHLRRSFTQGRFDSGGRLFGGFWQQMKEDDRIELLTISGEPVNELDYGQAGLRILYGMAGQVPPDGDLYDLPEFPDRRSSVKLMISAMTFSKKPLTRFPKRDKGKVRLFAKGMKVNDVVSAIERKHSLIADHFHRGLGHEVQFIESKIIIGVVMALKEVGVVALPVHDAIVVPQSATTKARTIMLDMFLSFAGVEGQVTSAME